MKKLLLVFVFAGVSFPLFAELSIIKVVAYGKKIHMLLDSAKDYQLGDVINYYKNGVLVTQGKVSYLTPRKSKAIVELLRGKDFESDLAARPRGMKVATPEKAVASNYSTDNEVEGTNPEKTYQGNEVDNEYSDRYYPDRKVASAYAGAPVRSYRPLQWQHPTQDLLYYPEENSFLLTTIGHFSQDTYKVEGLGSTKLSVTGLDASLYYSPFSKWAFGLGIGYASQNRTSTGTSNKGSGLVDPSLFASYRLMSPAENNYFWILTSEISPSIGKKENNNVLRGNTLIRLGTSFGTRYNAFSWTLGPKFGYYTQTKDNGGDMDAYYEMLLDIEGQYDFNPRWAIYSPLSLTYTGEQKAANGTYTIKSYLSYALGLGFKFAPSDRLNLFMNAVYATAPSVNIETTIPTSIKGSNNGFAINLGCNYNF